MTNDCLLNEVADYLSQKFEIEIEVESYELTIDTDQFYINGHWTTKQDYLLKLVEKMAHAVAKRFDIYLDYELECGRLTLLILE